MMSWFFWGTSMNKEATAGEMDKSPKVAFATLATHLDHQSDPATGAVIPPISLSTTFAQTSPGVPISEFEYSRSGNPTRKLLESAIARLEDASYGLAFASGSATTSAICHLLEPGAHVLSVNDVYGGTKRYLSKVLATFGVETTYTPMNDPEALRPLFKSNTKMVWIETPTNPTLALVDIVAVAKLAHGIRSDMIVVVDNTFMTPYLQRPLALGADVVVHSATKYLNGHCDVVMGLVATKQQHLYERLLFLQNALGSVPSPFDCYMVMRGMRTLHLRMDRHCQNALQVAQFLSKHPQVEFVSYPGLPSHPQHQLASQQQKGFGGMVSFRIKDADIAQTCRFCSACSIFVLAESLGGVESLIDIPAVMTHGAVPLEQREELGITDSFVRLSVGIEDADDLIADLKHALAASVNT